MCNDEIILEALTKQASMFGMDLEVCEREFGDFVLAFDRSNLPYIYLKDNDRNGVLNDILTPSELRGSEFVTIMLKDSIKGLAADWKKEIFRTHNELFMQLDLSDKVAGFEDLIDIEIETVAGDDCLYPLYQVSALVEDAAFLPAYVVSRSGAKGSKLVCSFAKLRGQPVAVLVQRLYHEYSVIEWVTTVSDYERRGFADKLIKYSLRYAKECGARAGYAKLREQHRSLFARVGFDVADQLQYYRFRLPRKPGNIELPKHVGYNGVLKRSNEYEEKVRILRELNLPLHFDPPKNWDSYAALDIILRKFGNDRAGKRILDAGGESYSSILSNLEACGFDKLNCINLSFPGKESFGNIVYENGDITKTVFDDDFFDVIVCLSVVEHGVDLQRYFYEMHRILKPGGFLITSTDYWNERVDTSSMKYAIVDNLTKSDFEVPVKIFCRQDILKAVEDAEEAGFSLMGNIELDCEDKVVSWIGLHFTFLYFTLVKS